MTFNNKSRQSQVFWLQNNTLGEIGRPIATNTQSITANAQYSCRNLYTEHINTLWANTSSV